MDFKACQNCIHFHPKDKDRLTGECRHSPPKVFMGPQDFHTRFPSVDGMDWCSFFGNRENFYGEAKRHHDSTAI